LIFPRVHVKASFPNNFQNHKAGGFESAFRVTGGYLKAGTSFLKRVTEKVFRIILKKHDETLFLIFSTTRKPNMVTLLLSYFRKGKLSESIVIISSSL
jgi:hypothetical protein